MHPIDVTTLSGNINPVDPYNLLMATENLYARIIAYGINDLKVTENTSKGQITKNALEITPRNRAVANLITRLIYRDENYISGDLEKIFGLDNTRLDVALADCDYFKPTSYGASLTHLLTVAEIINKEKCVNDTVIPVSNLKTLVDSKTRVNPWILMMEIDNLYRGIKAFGVENLNVSYTIGRNKPAVTKAINLSERCRGVANLIVRLIYRWEDYKSKRLEARFGITTDLEILLDDLKFFTPTTFSLNMTAFLTVAEVINAIVGGPGFFTPVPTNITALYKLTELHDFDVDPKNLLEAANSLYIGIKAVGVENLMVFYETPGGKHSVMASELPETLRAIADLIVRLKYRFNDYESERLDKRFGLDTPIKFLLNDLEVFSHTTYGCTLNVDSVSQIIERMKTKM